MKRLHKILLILLALVGIIIAVGYYFLSYRFVDEPVLSGTFKINTLSVNGRQRQYYTYTPKGITPTAMVIALHGSRNNGLGARKSFGYGFDTLADQQGFIAVYPDGFENHWNDCRLAAPYSANTKNINDVAFLQALKAQVSEQHKLVKPKAYLTGISNGGHMVLRMALEAPNSFDTFVPIIANMPTAENLGCTPKQQAVSIAFINGTADPLNPYNGGEVALYGLLSKRGTVISTDASIEYWRNLSNGRLHQQQRLANYSRADNSTVNKTTWHGDDGHRIVLFAVKGGGHAVPHSKQRMRRLLGATNQDVNAADLVWQFSRRK